MLRLGTIATAALILSTVLAQAQTYKPGQVWVNQSNSVLTIETIGTDGALTGAYVNNNSDFDCRGTPGYAVSGWVLGDLITFQVRWKNAVHDCRSIASWAGFAQSGTTSTNWDLVYIDSTNGKPAHVTGQDVFQLK